MMLVSMETEAAIQRVCHVVAIILFFCLVCPNVAHTESPTERRAAIEQQLKEAGRKWQGVEYERQQLREKYQALTKEQEGYAREAGKLQQELKGLVETSTGVVPGKKGKK